MIKPTIGIEIELPWRTMLARVDEEAAEILANSGSFHRLNGIERSRVQTGFDLVDDRYKDLVAGSFGDDIQRKHDGYAEFAFKPKADHAEITEVAAKLYDSGVLEDGEVYPLHVTLGGIAAQNSSWLILMAAELTGGASPARITQVNTWSQKGVAGVKQRHPSELELGAEVGIEMRTLEVRSLAGLGRTLAIAQAGGTLLLSKISGDQSAVAKWGDLYRYLMGAVEEHGVDARTRWKNPQQDRTPWQQLGAAMLDEDWACRVSLGTETILLG